ncbi:hypothetical protein Taro_010746 [Colocasia esculenta]|uniref:WRKY domain-containing protein n=1 Tax=Colocasia esculenta TaxID=4460 RepID=A0A843U8M2_COLES|nr:hypothetical protein [Colocasia esculenta]
MSGMEDNAPVIGDWTAINPSPRTLFSNFLSDDFSPRPFPDDPYRHGNGSALAEAEMPRVTPGPKEEDGEVGMEDSSDPFSQLGMFSGPRPGGPRAGLAERMAARAGFTAPKLNTARIRSVGMASSSLEIRSPYLTIPPGLSPTTLLDSPVFLSNSLVQPSPTTGKIPLDLSTNTNLASLSSISEKAKDGHLSDVGAELFAFKPRPQLSSSCFRIIANKAASVDHQQTLSGIKLSVQPEPPKHERPDTIDVQPQNYQDFNLKSELPSSSEQKDGTGDLPSDQNVSDSGMVDEPIDDQQDGEGENKGEFSSVPAGAPSDDGYNWRKYGQKQVKGSEYPRSYYKCTHPTCQVKKKVERSHDGHITEIIYKGAHNHPKPPPNRRSGIPTSHPFNDGTGGSEVHAPQPVDGKMTWGNSQNGNVGHDWKNDGPEMTSSATVNAELCDASSIQEQDRHHFESADAIDVSSNVSNDEDEDELATHGSVSLGGDGEGDESESKRRKLEASAMEMGAGSRAVREPRVVVQTTSEVDILDDGYRWRKYGQKVVKGNPNPRSYYKCTSPGCTVRKHVERASHDLKSVITTYEGKHNHDVPAARNSSHANAGPSSMAPTSASQAHNTQKRPELPQDSLPRFNAPPLSSFALSGREQLGHPPSLSFSVGHHGLSNLGMAGLGPATQMKMLPTVHPYMGLHRVNEASFMMPKGEPKEEPMTEASLSIPNGPAVYHHIMSRLPLGPQL